LKYSNELLLLGKEAKEAAKVLASLDSEDRNRSLYKIAENLMVNKEQILIANKKDCEEAISNGLDDSLIDRIYLDDKRLSDISKDVITIAELPDPLDEIFDIKSLPNGLRIEKRRVPLGVIGAIYENRPNVTVDFSALCIKSGNAVILRGGKEGILTNIALSGLIRDSLVDTGVNKNIIQIVKSTNRDLVNQMLNMKDYIDLIIPRGGSKLVNMVANKSRIPAITGGIGVCHVYVDEYADIDMAISIVNNAKVNRPSVCNAMDTLLINKNIYQELLPKIANVLFESGVEIRCDERAFDILKAHNSNLVVRANQDDWGMEFLSLIASVKIVDSMQDAFKHIEEFGSGHTEAIITNNSYSSDKFLDEVDASAVMVNASTRFNDGGQFGLGAEVAISTNKIHARGPMGLRELTSYKWIVIGDGQIRA
tara:strand:+ start:84 stop:1355 length:1272 start_codon:yes stop_codon:yes gene_type:complete